MALTAKQSRFIDEYLVDLNATQAAIRAGYSPKTAQEQGARLLSNVMLQAALQEALQRRQDRVELTQDMVVDELRKVGFADAADYTDAKLKYSNKIRALELLGKHLGLFEKRDGGGGEENGGGVVVLAPVKEEAGGDGA